MKYKKSPTYFSKKFPFYQILLLLAIIGIVYFFKPPSGLPNRSPSNPATLAINFETEKRLFEGEVVKGMTVLDALNAAVSVGKIKFDFAIDKSGGVNILEIDGHVNGAGNKYFFFYLNSEKVAARDLNKKIVHGGDRIEIKSE